MFNLPMSDYALELRPLRIENKKTRPKKRKARIELIYTQETNEGDMYIYNYPKTVFLMAFHPPPPKITRT